MSQVFYSHKRILFHVIYDLQIKQFDDKAFLTLDLKILARQFYHYILSFKYQFYRFICSNVCIVHSYNNSNSCDFITKLHRLKNK